MKLLIENQTLTTTFADLGPEINLEGTRDVTIKFSFLTVDIGLDINDSKDFQIKAKSVQGARESDFPLKSVKRDKVLVRPDLQEFDLDVDADQIFDFILDNTIDSVQLQVRVDTLGATPGEVLIAQFELGYRQ